MGTIIKRPDIKGDIVHVANDRYGNILVIDDRKHRILSFDSVFEQSKIILLIELPPYTKYFAASIQNLTRETPRIKSTPRWLLMRCVTTSLHVVAILKIDILSLINSLLILTLFSLVS